MLTPGAQPKMLVSISDWQVRRHYGSGNARAQGGDSPARSSSLKHENAQLACQRTCNSQHRHDVAFTDPCYVLLGAINSQLIAITTAGGFQRRCTGTGVWFGQTEAT
jgi:hypothetical protein